MVVVKPTGKGGKPLKPKPIKPKPQQKAGGGMGNKPKKPKIIQLMPKGVFYKGKAKDYPGIKELIKRKNKKAGGGMLKYKKGGGYDSGTPGKLRDAIEKVKGRLGSRIGKTARDRMSDKELKKIKEMIPLAKKAAGGMSTKKDDKRDIRKVESSIGASRSSRREMGRKAIAKRAKGGFGMLSVKAGIDKNPNPTQADRIAGAKMNKPKKAMMGLAVQVAKKAKDKGAKGAEFLSPLALLNRAFKKDGGMMKSKKAKVGALMSIKANAKKFGMKDGGEMKRGYGAARQTGMGLQDENLTPGKTMDYYKDLM